MYFLLPIVLLINSFSVVDGFMCVCAGLRFLMNIVNKVAGDHHDGTNLVISTVDWVFFAYLGTRSFEREKHCIVCACDIFFSSSTSHSSHSLNIVVVVYVTAAKRPVRRLPFV